jgi:hypothetical protein
VRRKKKKEGKPKEPQTQSKIINNASSNVTAEIFYDVSRHRLIKVTKVMNIHP